MKLIKKEMKCNIICNYVDVDLDVYAFKSFILVQLITNLDRY